MPKSKKPPSKPSIPTIRQSLAKISESLSQIALYLKCGLYDGKGDSALENIQEAVCDIAQYGAGKAPKELYEWRHQNIGKDQSQTDETS